MNEYDDLWFIQILSNQELKKKLKHTILANN